MIKEAEQVWVRRGQTITNPEGHTQHFKSINAAKRASRDITKGGGTVRAEKAQKQLPTVRRSQVQTRRSAMQVAKPRRELSQEAIAEIARHLGNGQD